MLCPICEREGRRYGRDRYGNQRYFCRECYITFSEPRPPRPFGNQYLTMERAASAVKLLMEGNSIRSTCRLLSMGPATLLQLLLKVGEGCESIMKDFIVGVPCATIQCDEIWSFVFCKEKTRARKGYGDEDIGDCYTWTAIEPRTKLLLAYAVGKRDNSTGMEFLRRPHQAGRAGSSPASRSAMFVGSINADLRSILARLASAWRGLPVYVGCSGNFTVERILAAQGLTDLHGNDVSLYSCALGAYLSGQPFRVEVQNGDLAWLSDWLQPGLPTLATLLLCTSVLEFHDRDSPYHRRMWNAYLRRWPNLHAKTLANLEKGLAGLSLCSFFAGDVVDFLASAPQEGVVISFPPTYKGGYERLYKKLQAAFSWDEPAYQLFTAERFETLLESMTSKRFWYISRDERVPALAHHTVGRVQTSLRSKPVYVYANVPAAILTQPRQRLADVLYPRLSEPPVEGPATIIALSQEQLNTLRSEYLSPSIVPGSVMWAFGLLLGGRLAGAFAFASSRGPVAFGDVYMTSDFAVQSSVPRLSKLVLACILSTEVRDILEQKLAQKVRSIGTTAFTDKPVSMKYRGIFDLHSRKEGRLNYLGEAGKWTLEQALTWWRKTQQKQPSQR